MSTYATGLLLGQFQSAHDWLEGTVGDITTEQAHWSPEGLPSPIAAQYLHVVVVEDGLIGALNGSGPLMTDAFADKVGASELPPPGQWADWGRGVQVDMALARDYARGVYAATEVYLQNIEDDDLNTEVDLGETMGHQKLAYALNLLLRNPYSHTGEIAALKGLQGLKGYPA